MDKWIITWIAIGVVLIAAETIIPGAVLSFLGIAAIGVGILMQFEIITGLQEIVLTFMGISMFLLIFVRSFFLRLMPGDTSVASTNEDDEYEGAIVEVIEEILPQKSGRVRFRDTTWVAQSDQSLAVGDNVVVTSKKGQRLYVKSI